MNTLNIPPHLIQSLGWTLVHAWWQVLIILIVLKLVTRWIPTTKATLRYTLSVAAMVLAIAASITTFVFLFETPPIEGTLSTFSIQANAPVEATKASWLAMASNWVDHNIIWLIRFWILGFLISLIRVGMGLWYIDHLRRKSVAVDPRWQDLITELIERLKIPKVVVVAEAKITSPIVVGVMKPMILFPMGLLTGLTAEQVEAIFVHELSHIRRQDYLINLIQAFVESVYFYNPFMLLISAQIREERENCCDDIVIAHGANPINYIRTLAQLEASRSSTTLAVGFASNKNQLLNRMKRIMEKSAQNDWGKGRFLPLALLVVGFMCASWLSIGTDGNAPTDHQATIADTAKAPLRTIHSSKNNKSESVEKERVDRNPKLLVLPDGVTEIEDVDPKLFELMFDSTFLRMPDPNSYELMFDQFARRENLAFLDSLPPANFKMRMPGEDFAAFQEDFMKRFQEQFKEFYEKNGDKLNQIMEEAKRRHEESAEVVDLDMMRRDAAMEAEEMARRSAEFNRSFQKENLKQMMRNSEMLNADIMLRNKQTLEELKATLDVMDDMPRIPDAQLRRDAEIARDMAFANKSMLEDLNQRNEQLTAELTKMLAEDGYIKKGDKLKEMNISDDGATISINGHKIKEKDAPKYRALYDRFMAPWREKPRERYRKPE